MAHAKFGAAAAEANPHGGRHSLSAAMFNDVCHGAQDLLTDAQRGGHNGLRLGLNLLQMVRTAITLGVDLVDVFGAGWSRGEPAPVRDHLESADRSVVPGRLRE